MKGSSIDNSEVQVESHPFGIGKEIFVGRILDLHILCPSVSRQVAVDLRCEMFHTLKGTRRLPTAVCGLSVAQLISVDHDASWLELPYNSHIIPRRNLEFITQWSFGTVSLKFYVAVIWTTTTSINMINTLNQTSTQTFGF